MKFCYLLSIFAIATPLVVCAKPPDAPATSMLRVACEGDDIGSEVKVNGKFKGECPLDVQVASGTLTLRLEKKYAPYDPAFEQRIRIGDGVVKKIEAVLPRHLNAAQRELMCLSDERAEVARREAGMVQKRTEIEADIASHMVRIQGKNYEIGKHEVTQGQWKAIMGINPSKFINCGDNCPVERVSWNDVQEFIQTLNGMSGKHYRLPTEAEWEHACNGGSENEYCGGSDLGAVAWYKDNSNNQTNPAGKKQANGNGLYDMSGNVWEWMQDCYKEDCSKRMVRGGSWLFDPENLRASNRGRNAASNRDHDVGFRLARTLP